MATAAPSTTQVETPNPKSVSSDYKAMAPYWKLIDAVLHGVEALRAVAGEGGKGAIAGPVIPYASLQQLNNPRRGRDGARSPYLPQFEGELNEDYERRRSNAPLTNIYDDISKNLASKPFSKTCELEDGSDAQLVELQDDVDGEGNNLHVFASKTFKSGLDKGIDWIFVDYDSVGENITLDAERKYGLRPYWVHIPCERMLAVYSDFVNGEEVFVHSRVYEPSMVRDGYDEKTVERVRIYDRKPTLDPVTDLPNGYGTPTWELWELQEAKDPNSKEKEAWNLIDSGIITLGKIPLVPFMTGERKNSTWNISPPLKNLGHMQIEEFQQESNLKSIKEMTAFPMLAGNGVSPPTDAKGNEVIVNVGPKRVLYAPPHERGQGSWNYIEPTANSLNFLATDLEKLRTEMRDLGMQPLTSSNLTVITTANLSAKAHSAVQAWALQLKDALRLAWQYTAQWLGKGEAFDVNVNVHTDFGVDLTAETELPVLLTAEQQGIISKLTVGDEMKRRGVLADDWDPDEEAKKLAKQQAALMPEIPIDPVTGNPVSGTPFKPGAPTMSLADRLAAKKKDIAIQPPPKGPLQ